MAACGVPVSPRVTSWFKDNESRHSFTHSFHHFTVLVCSFSDGICLRVVIDYNYSHFLVWALSGLHQQTAPTSYVLTTPRILLTILNTHTKPNFSCILNFNSRLHCTQLLANCALLISLLLRPRDSQLNRHLVRTYLHFPFFPAPYSLSTTFQDLCTSSASLCRSKLLSSMQLVLLLLSAWLDDIVAPEWRTEQAKYSNLSNTLPPPFTW